MPSSSRVRLFPPTVKMSAVNPTRPLLLSAVDDMTRNANAGQLYTYIAVVCYPWFIEIVIASYRNPE